MNDAAVTALRGFRVQLDGLERTARSIASDDRLTSTPQDLVQLRVHRHGAAANAAVIRTADEMTGTLLDIIR